MREGEVVVVMGVSGSARLPVCETLRGGGGGWSENQMALQRNVTRPVCASNLSAFFFFVGSTFDERSHFTS